MADAMDRHAPEMATFLKEHGDGTGKFFSEEVEKPDVLRDVPRAYKRYGMPDEVFDRVLPDTDVDIVLVSSGMTYWYPGVFRVIRMARERYDKAVIVLGGVYATLCHDHAVRHSGADHVIASQDIRELGSITGGGEEISFARILDEDLDYSYYPNTPYAVLRLSLGCPFDCAYCAQRRLSPPLMRKTASRAFAEIKGLYEKGIRKFAFYDDALLSDGQHFCEYLDLLEKGGIKADFYTPNGLHARFMTDEIARKMRGAGFVRPILSLETADDIKGAGWHEKVTKDELEGAVRYLYDAGYRRGDITVYLMLGVPGSTFSDVEGSIAYINSLGARISLSEFSPVPGTRLAGISGERINEPLLQNNSVFPSFAPEEWDKVSRIKEKARMFNRSLDERR